MENEIREWVRNTNHIEWGKIRRKELILMVREMRRILGADAKERPTKRQVLDEICKYYSIDSNLLRGTIRKSYVVLPRQMAMYLMREIVKDSYPQIARYMRKNDHTTVMRACRKIEGMLKRDESICKAVQVITEALEYKLNSGKQVFDFSSDDVENAA